MGARIEDFPHEFFGFVHAEDQDLHGGSDLPDLAGGLQPVQLRHGDVQDGDIRFELLRQGNDLAAGDGFPADLAVRLTLQQGADTGAYHLVIIGDEDAERAHDAALAFR